MSTYVKGALGRMITGGDKVAYIRKGPDGQPTAEERYVKDVYGGGYVLLALKKGSYLPRLTSGRFCILLERDS